MLRSLRDGHIRVVVTAMEREIWLLRGTSPIPAKIHPRYPSSYLTFEWESRGKDASHTHPPILDRFVKQHATGCTRFVALP